jgi:hypothetical protein
MHISILKYILILFWVLNIQISYTLPKTNVDCGSLNALGGKSLVIRSVKFLFAQDLLFDLGYSPFTT